jgi:superfamily I DNA/RNA helicase
LVDECQDLKGEVLNLVTEVFGSDHTNFTFVGDPKQNIMGFAGAQQDIFALLKEKFPNETHSVIATSFRLPQEIAEFANDFIRKFMNYRDSIRTIKSNNGHKPQIIVVGQESDYQLSYYEEKEVEKELELNNPELTKKRSEIIREKIRSKKLKRHLDTILPIISQLDSQNSKAILYRKNWIGKLLQK